MAQEVAATHSNAFISGSMVPSFLNDTLSINTRDPVEGNESIPGMEVVIEQAIASTIQNHNEVSEYDAPMSHSGRGRKGLVIWREVRGPPRRPNDQEREAQALRERYADAVRQGYPQAVEELGRNPMILQLIDSQKEDIPHNALRITNSKGESTYWREASAHEIFTHIRNVRQNGQQRRSENQHDGDTLENNIEDDQDEDMPDGEEESNGADGARAYDMESVLYNASIRTFAVSVLSDAVHGNKTTLSEESKRKLDDPDSVLTKADMSDLIRECQNVYDFLAVYHSSHYKRRLQRIRRARGTMGRIEFAEKWANNLHDGDSEAEELDSARRMCLSLLYVMCDRWGGPDIKTQDSPVREEDIVQLFRREYVLNILTECLAMDRASAWYNLPESGQGRRGVHWYARDHHDWYVAHGNGRDHDHTMNKRLVWLFNIEGLRLREDAFVNELMTPARTPLADL